MLILLTNADNIWSQRNEIYEKNNIELYWIEQLINIQYSNVIFWKVGSCCAYIQPFIQQSLTSDKETFLQDFLVIIAKTSK